MPTNMRHSRENPRSFENPYLKDDVERVGRQPLRKLSAGDRLIKPLLGTWNMVYAWSGQRDRGGDAFPVAMKNPQAQSWRRDYRKGPQAALASNFRRNGCQPAMWWRRRLTHITRPNDAERRLACAQIRLSDMQAIMEQTGPLKIIDGRRLNAGKPYGAS